MPQPTTTDLYRATQRRSLATALGVRSLWGQIDPAGDWEAQWREMMPRAVLLTGAAQIGAATDGAASVAASLSRSGFPEPQLAAVDPRAFGGWVESDLGFTVPLDKALTVPVITARKALGESPQMLAAGLSQLEAIVRTAVSDAGRHATHAQAVATRRTVAAWYDPPPYCQRCAVLIGKRVKPTTQFARHPGCDGQVQILSERDDAEQPAASLDDITDLNDGQRRAIEDGADMNQVINAYRGSKMSAKWTTEGTTRRGWASYVDREVAKLRGTTARETATHVGQRGYIKNYAVRRAGPRPTPGAIYDYADRHGMSREEIVQVLHRSGYVVGNLADVARIAG